MSETIGAVTCIHIPPLYAGDRASISWIQVPGAVSYKLDACFCNGSSVWGAWDNLYTGAAGLDLEVACEDLPPGLMWKELDAKGRTWDEWNLLGLSWAAFEKLVPDARPHRTASVAIPKTAWRAQFRIAALDADGNAQKAFESPQLRVITRSETDLAVVAGDTAYVQVDKQLIFPPTAGQFTIRYDTGVLALASTPDNLFPGGQKGAGMAYGPVDMQTGDGTVTFTCAPGVAEKTVWSGAIARVCFTAKQTASTKVRLECG